MLLTNKRWNDVRHLFDAAEKASINGAVIGQVICPSGSKIDPSRLSDALRDKLEKAIKVHP